jgi:hypothetical protein
MSCVNGHGDLGVDEASITVREVYMRASFLNSTGCVPPWVRILWLAWMLSFRNFELAKRAEVQDFGLLITFQAHL